MGVFDNLWKLPGLLNDGAYNAPYGAFGTGSPAEDAYRPRGILDNMVSGVGRGLLNGAMAPGRVFNSTTPMTSEQMIPLAMNMAGMMTLGAGAVPAEANALRSGLTAVRNENPSIITSQHYLDDGIVNKKIAAKDFDVSLSPPFEIEGKKYQVVLDGHHSLEAAKRTGNEPSFNIPSPSEDDRINLLKQGKIDDFLQSTWVDGDYIHAIDRKPVW